MKFLTKINRIYFIILTISFIVLSISVYFIILQIMNEETEEHLYEQAILLEKEIKETGSIPNIYPIIETKLIVNNNKVQKAIIKTVFIPDFEENEDEPYLELSKYITINNNTYNLKIRQSLLEKDDLLISIISSLLLILFLVFFVIFLGSKKSTKNLWFKFHDNLIQIENYSFMQNKPIKLSETKIEEFDKLNMIIQKMTSKLSSDYNSLKEFTENISHELQTPLSIISMNLEEVLQNKLPDYLLNKVYTSYQSIKKLAGLNQGLILLAKIENQQFRIDNTVTFNNLILKKITELKPLIENKNIHIEKKIISEFEINANLYLIEILINNLLSNAIKHNIDNGFIKIIIQNNKFKICNSGINSKTVIGNEIFNRFVKGNSQSYGLGLAIVKKICDIYNLKIEFVKDKSTFCLKIRK